MPQLSRRTAIKLATASSLFLFDRQEQERPPKYVTENAEIKFHSTTNYPRRWQQIYQNTLNHFSKKWGRVGPTHVFLIENDDWEETKNAPEKVASLKASQKILRSKFCELHGQDSNGDHLDWSTGNHWSSWSLTPPNVVITMTMSPYRDGEQFVIGPMHEYVHAIQIAFGNAKEAIAGNRMGHALWTGPAWFREGSAVLVAALHAYQNPKLFDQLKGPYTWRQFSAEMNRNLGLYQKAATPIHQGVTHNDWQRLEPQELVYPTIYCGGSIACAWLLKQSGSLTKFMDFFSLVPTLGWQTAFENHFQIKLSAFYKALEQEVNVAQVQNGSGKPKEDWFRFLKTIDS